MWSQPGMRKPKKEYFYILDHVKVTHNKKFWKTKATFFTNEGIIEENIAVVENGKIPLNCQEICETLNKLFLM